MSRALDLSVGAGVASPASVVGVERIACRVEVIFLFALLFFLGALFASVALVGFRFVLFQVFRLHEVDGHVKHTPGFGLFPVFLDVDHLGIVISHVRLQERVEIAGVIKAVAIVVFIYSCVILSRREIREFHFPAFHFGSSDRRV